VDKLKVVEQPPVRTVQVPESEAERQRAAAAQANASASARQTVRIPDALRKRGSWRTRGIVAASAAAAILLLGLGVPYAYREMNRDDPKLAQNNKVKPIELEEPATPPTEPAEPVKPAEPLPPEQPKGTAKPATVACQPYDPYDLGREEVLFPNDPYKGWYSLDCGAGSVVLGKPQGKPAHGNLWRKADLIRIQTVIARR
jgi:hypothetical protein